LPITSYLGESRFDCETKRVMGLAFEVVCATLKMTDLDDKFKPVIAGKIIALANAGERDPNTLCQQTLTELPEQLADAATSDG
jgi:hypothetical protein